MADQVIIRRSGHQELDTLDAADIPALSYEASGAIGTHAGAADPHAVYQLESGLAAAITATKLDDLAAPDDTTDLDASTSKHGLLKKLPGGTTDFLRADGSFAAPPGGAPSGAAGGVLGGTYPNPRFTPGAVQPHRLVSLVSGVLAEPFDKSRVTTNVGLLSTGRLSSMALQVLAGVPCTNVSFCSATTAIVTATDWWFALCDNSWNLIRQSTDQLATAWTANTPKTLAIDSVPTTAGARVASSTVTLTIPTLAQPLSDLFAPGDSVVVSNASIAAYNGTFSVATVTATTITYVSGGSASDSLSAPFPTIQLAAAKRVYTPAADALLRAVIMVKATTVPSLACSVGGLSGLAAVGTELCTSGDTGQTGTCPSPIAHGTGAGGVQPWCAIS